MMWWAAWGWTSLALEDSTLVCSAGGAERSATLPSAWDGPCLLACGVGCGRKLPLIGVPLVL